MNSQQWSSDDHDYREIRRQFRRRFLRQDVASQAEAFLRQRTESGDSCFMFTHSVGGLVGYTIRRLLVRMVEPCRISDDLILQFVSDYGFAPDWVPPRLLVREALAHAVHLRRLVERLRREVGGGDDSGVVIERAAGDIPSAEAAFRLSDEEADAVIRTLR